MSMLLIIVQIGLLAVPPHQRDVYDLTPDRLHHQPTATTTPHVIHSVSAAVNQKMLTIIVLVALQSASSVLGAIRVH